MKQAHNQETKYFILNRNDTWLLKLFDAIGFLTCKKIAWRKNKTALLVLKVLIISRKSSFTWGSIVKCINSLGRQGYYRSVTFTGTALFIIPWQYMYVDLELFYALIFNTDKNKINKTFTYFQMIIKKHITCFWCYRNPSLLKKCRHHIYLIKNLDNWWVIQSKIHLFVYFFLTSETSWCLTLKDWISAIFSNFNCLSRVESLYISKCLSSLLQGT